MTNLTLRQKILQIFILGYEQQSPDESFFTLVKEGLGGVIFFTHNINSKEQFKRDVEKIKKYQNPDLTLFLSIDQEGGRVERTLNIHGGQHYLCARDAAKKGEGFVREQTAEIARELRDFGLNMNFAPVLDVDTNPDNPVIAERSYSTNPDIVAKMGEISAKTYLENGIIPVCKHFPGHGETKIDSHLAMPELELSLEELEHTHVAPFKSLMKPGFLPAVMVAHVYYSAFEGNVIGETLKQERFQPCDNTKKIPASISKTVITDYLRGELGFNGLVISDDMVMGGIKAFSAFEACKKGIEAGVNMFIYRDANSETLELIERIESAVKNGEIDLEKIDESLLKINKTSRLLLR